MTRLRLGVAVAVLASFGVARADVQQVTIETSGNEPSCLVPARVAAALREDALLRVTVSDQAAAGANVLRISGTAQRFTLQLTVGKDEVGQVFAGVPCEAATQVVVAFVRSVLPVQEAPKEPPASSAEPIVSAPLAPAPSDTPDPDLAALVLAELEAAGRPIDSRTLTLSVSRTTSGSLAIWFTHNEELCSTHRELTREASTGDRRRLVANLTVAAASMLDSQRDCLAPEAVQRAEILAESLKTATAGSGLAKLGAGLEGVGGVVIGTVLLAEETDRDLARGLGIVGAGIWAAGGTASLLMADHDQAGTVATVTTLTGLGTFSMAMAFVGEQRNVEDEIILPDQRHDAYVIGGLALYGTAAVLAMDRVRHPQASLARLASHYDRITTSTQRRKISDEQLARIEGDFLRSESPTSSWWLASPLLVGAGACGIGYLIEDDSNEQESYLVVGGLMLLEGTLMAALSETLSPIRRYRKKLSEAGLDVHLQPMPNGVALSGRF